MMPLAIAAALLLQSSGLSLTVDRAWTEQIGSNSVGRVLVTVTNNAARSFEWIMVDCTLSLNGSPVETARASLHNVRRGQAASATATVWNTHEFDSASCRIGPVSGS